MKISLKGYGSFILFGIIAYVAIFYFFSRQFEKYVYYQTLDKYNVATVGASSPSAPGQSQAPF